MGSNSFATGRSIFVAFFKATSLRPRASPSAASFQILLRAEVHVKSTVRQLGNRPKAQGLDLDGSVHVASLGPFFIAHALVSPEFRRSNLSTIA